MYLFFDYYSLSLFMGGVVALISGLIVFLNNSKSRVNISWLLLTITSAIWSFGYLVLINATNSTVALIGDWILHAAATLIPIAYLSFILHLTGFFEEMRVVFRNIMYGGLILFLCVPFSFFNAPPIPKLTFSFAPDAGPLYGIFTAYFFSVALYAFGIIIRALFSQKSREEKIRLKFVFYSSLFGFMGGGSVFLLTFDIMVPPYPLILFTLYPMIIAYAIVRHRLLNMKMITAEVMTLALWFLLLMRTLLSGSVQEQILNSLVFLSSLVIGVFLIKSVGKEVKAHEETEELAKNLRNANARLRELDRQKTEFVSIASHQLRTPLTAIKGYSSMLLDGSFGKLCKGTIDPVEKIYRSSQRLVSMVEDFLNITRIEQGRMMYDFMAIDVYEICKNVVEEISFEAEEKGLTIVFTYTKPGMFVWGDKEKIRQAVLNLIDNAIKYTEEGEVQVSLEESGQDNIIFQVSDTGIGIPRSFQERMFDKFSRARNSEEHHPNGSGIGLYIVKEIVEAHKGVIEVDSKEGVGSTFAVTLPRLQKEGSGMEISA